MLRGRKTIDTKDFLEYYKIPYDEFYKYMRAKGFNFTHLERRFISNQKGIEEKKENSIANINGLNFNWMNVDEIPKALICALYQVDFEIVNGKAFYDVEEFVKAKDDVDSKIMQYSRILKSNEESAYSKLKPIDLVAMRIFRGYNRVRFSKLSGIKIDIIKQYESKESKIPNFIAKDYMSSLGIRKRHIIQLRDIMSGKSKEITDDRDIPKLIKLRVWSRDEGQCVKCESKYKLHYHHKKHFAEGGQHTEENLILLCATCHAEEHKGEKAYHMLKKMAEG